MLKKEKKIIIICYLISYVLCLLSIMHRNFYATMEIEQSYCFCAFSHIICTHEYLKQRHPCFLRVAISLVVNW